MYPQIRQFESSYLEATLASRTTQLRVRRQRRIEFGRFAATIASGFRTSTARGAAC
jgi:hypothetical protein